MSACNPRGPLVVAVAKLFPRQDCSRFDALGRVMSGTLRPGDTVKVGRGPSSWKKNGRGSNEQDGAVGGKGFAGLSVIMPGLCPTPLSAAG